MNCADLIQSDPWRRLTSIDLDRWFPSMSAIRQAALEPEIKGAVRSKEGRTGRRP